MRIYTRTGDEGTTGLFGGLRLSKGSPRVEAYGGIDEVNAAVGWARAHRLPGALDEHLDAVQRTCFRLGAWLASAPDADPGVPPLSDGDVAVLESAIDRLDGDLPELRSFVLPGGSEAGARLHLARTLCRRAERAIVLLKEVEPVAPVVLRWVNRLSDLLFVAARWANHEADVPERPWSS